jgi:Cyclin, N-terminal domain/Cyclin, C-terminal domain
MSSSVVSLDSIIDRVNIMRKQEDGPYLYQSYLLSTDDIKLNVAWREKITHWSYNVVDHFELSREVVAISLSLFDRFLATRGNKCSGNLALLTSLTTLHLAIKVHDTKKIRLSTLANLSRGQFGPSHIEEMEWVILKALNWKLHPPTSYSFIFHVLLFLPQEANAIIRKDIFELSRYLTELAACDSYLVPEKASTIAFASILHVLDDISYSILPAGLREKFLRELLKKVGLHHRAPEVIRTRERIASMFSSNSSQRIHSWNPDSTTDEETKSITTNGSSGSLTHSIESHGPNNRKRSNSSDTKVNFRFCASPISRRITSSSPIGRSRVASALLVTGIQ